MMFRKTGIALLALCIGLIGQTGELHTKTPPYQIQKAIKEKLKKKTNKKEEGKKKDKEKIQPPPPEVVFDKSLWTVDHDLCIVHAIPKCGTHLIQPIVKLITQKNVNNHHLITPNSLKNYCAANQIIRIFHPFIQGEFNILMRCKHKLICLVRDPRDALLSCLFYMRSFADLDTPDKTKRDFFRVGADFDECTLQEQLYALIVGNDHAQSYINFYKERAQWALKTNSFVVKFEDIIGYEGGGSDEIRRETVFAIADYIHSSLDRSVIEQGLAETYTAKKEQVEDGKTFKRGTFGNWKEFLTEEHKVLIKEMLGEVIIALGYEQDNNW